MDFSEIFFSELNDKVSESMNIIEELKKSKDKKYIKDLYRIFHTLKGSASLVNLENFRDFSHKVEQYFKESLESEKLPDESFLDNLIAVISNFSKKNTDLTETEVKDFLEILEGKKNASENIVITEKEIFKISEISKYISKVLEIENSILRNDLKSALNEIRNLKKSLLNTLDEIVFVKLENILKNLKKLVSREANRYGKKVELLLEIENVKIEKEDSKDIIDILVHLVRNSIAHGIENPDERKSLGKDEVGKIWIRSYVDQGNIFIEVEDDGKGLDIEQIEKKVKEKNLNVTPLEAIFLPGFSSKDKADELSGRGIGLDMVKNFATLRGGDVKVETQKGKGTKFIVFFKTKSFITKVLVVEDSERIFAIETSHILKIINYNEKEMQIDNKIASEGKLYEIYYKSKKPKFVIITKNEKAIVVSNIIGTFDGQLVVQEIRELKGFIKNIFSSPIPLLDTNTLKKKETSKNEKKKQILLIDDSIVTRNVVSKFLENRGYQVVTAKDGYDGIEKFKKQEFDLVISDAEMPEIDGFETTKKIKEINDNVPVIIFSTLSQENFDKAIESGADSFISKDEPPENLLRLIEKFSKWG